MLTEEAQLMLAAQSICCKHPVFHDAWDLHSGQCAWAQSLLVGRTGANCGLHIIQAVTVKAIYLSPL